MSRTFGAGRSTGMSSSSLSIQEPLGRGEKSRFVGREGPGQSVLRSVLPLAPPCPSALSPSLLRQSGAPPLPRQSSAPPPYSALPPRLESRGGVGLKRQARRKPPAKSAPCKAGRGLLGGGAACFFHPSLFSTLTLSICRGLIFHVPFLF